MAILDITTYAGPYPSGWGLLDDDAQTINDADTATLPQARITALKMYETAGASGGVTDDDAIHDNVAAEISAITEKVTPISADLVVIEDSAAANVKKKVQVGNLPGGDITTDPAFDAKGDLIVGTGADTAARLAIGANDTIPIADSGEATGIRWGAQTGGGGGALQFTELLNQTFTGQSSVDVDCTGYDQVQLVWEDLDFSVPSRPGLRVSTDGITFDSGATDYRQLNLTDISQAPADLSYILLGGDTLVATDHYGTATVFNLAESGNRTAVNQFGGDDASGNTAKRYSYRKTAQTDTHIRIISGAGGTIDSGTLRVLGVGTAKSLSASTPDANIQGVVNQIDVITMSSMTANRDYTLPTTAAVGQIAGISIVDGDPAFEILIKSGAAGDKINNVDHSTNEFTRLFIAGERMVFECIDAAGPHWQVKEDGRIPAYGIMYHATTWTHTSTSAQQEMQLDTIESQRGGICDTSQNRIKVRRDCRMDVEMQAGLVPSGSGKFITIEFWAGSVAASLTPTRWTKEISGAASTQIATGKHLINLSADDEIVGMVSQNDSTSEAISFSVLTATEQL